MTLSIFDDFSFMSPLHNILVFCLIVCHDFGLHLKKYKKATLKQRPVSCMCLKTLGLSAYKLRAASLWLDCHVKQYSVHHRETFDLCCTAGRVTLCHFET